MKRSILVLIRGAGIAGTTLAQTTQLAQGDRNFTETVASKGKMEVAVSQHAADHGARPDVQEVARMMVTDHGRANAELADLAGQKGITLPADLQPDHKALQDRLTALEGEELDEVYLDEMAKGHQGSLDLLKSFQQDGADAELKAFAEKIEPVVTHHLDMVKNAQEGKPIHQAREGAAVQEPARDAEL